jgi:hypothetical protein
MSLPIVRTFVLSPMAHSSINGNNTKANLVDGNNVTIRVVSIPLTTGGTYHRVMVSPFTLTQAAQTASDEKSFYALPTEFKRFLAATPSDAIFFTMTSGHAGQRVEFIPEPVTLINSVPQTGLVPGFWIWTHPVQTASPVAISGGAFDIFTEA